MAVDPANLLLANGGEVDPAFFPDVANLEDVLAAYVRDGVARVAMWMGVNGAIPAADQDRAVEAWAYHRAFKQAYITMLANPARAEVSDQGSHQFIREQILELAKLRDSWQAEYTARLDSSSVSVTGIQSTTGYARNVYIF